MPYYTDKGSRRFLPELIETSSQSSKPKYPRRGKKNSESDLSGSAVPQSAGPDALHGTLNFSTPVTEGEPTQLASPSWTHYKSSLNADPNTNNANADIQGKPLPRRFTPVAVETAKRSFRKGQHHLVAPKHKSPFGTQTNTIARSGVDRTDTANESRFSYLSLKQRQEARRHSFRVPNLPAIPSSCSETSDGPDSPPAADFAPQNSSSKCEMHAENKENGRGAFQEQPKDDILSLADYSAERQLKDQALAAYPNEQVYQPVDHFAINREESDDEALKFHEEQSKQSIYRRTSSADLSWELDYMRRHKEEAEMMHRAMAGTRGGKQSAVPETWYKLKKRNGGLGSVLSRAATEKCAQGRYTSSPPMLGEDLVFPQSSSPETTIQYGMSQVNYNARARDKPTNYCGLWSANPWPEVHYGKDGLWMGTCKPGKQDQKPQDCYLPGISTPVYGMDTGNRLFPHETLTMKLEPQMFPEASNTDPVSDDGQLRPALQEDPNYEFDDGFITQIYNYLSLGYPCVARYFDRELSKVSGIPVADLRRDDLNTDAKGYVDVSSSIWMDRGAARNTCIRWTALRLYICEWAKQQPKTISGDNNHETWGVRERRGSWAG